VVGAGAELHDCQTDEAGTYEVAMVVGATGAGALLQSAHVLAGAGGGTTVVGATGAGALLQSAHVLWTGAGGGTTVVGLTGAGEDQSFHTEDETGAGAGLVLVVHCSQVEVTTTGLVVVVVVVPEGFVSLIFGDRQLLQHTVNPFGSRGGNHRLGGGSGGGSP
jgi:hypothetical protein